MYKYKNYVLNLNNDPESYMYFKFSENQNQTEETPSPEKHGEVFRKLIGPSIILGLKL